MSASDALLVGEGGVLLPVDLAGVEEPEEAGALAAGAGVALGAGAGVGAGAALAPPEAAGAAEPDSLFLLLRDDFLPDEVSAVAAVEESAEPASPFLLLRDDFFFEEVSALAAAEVSLVAADFLLFFAELLVEAVSDEAFEVSVGAASPFFDFLDFFDLVLEELWSLLEAPCDCAQLKFIVSARRKQNDTTNAYLVFIE